MPQLVKTRLYVPWAQQMLPPLKMHLEDIKTIEKQLK